MGVQERLSLEAVSAETLIASEHVHRYRLAADLCRGMRVVDLACGSGYGSAILRETAESVHAVDNDIATVDMATVTVGAEHEVGFEAADALEFVRRDIAESFDAIVCLEGLAHFADPEAVLESMARHAAAGIRLVLSVPNQDDWAYEAALEAFGRFDEVTVLYQFLAEGSLLRGEEPADVAAEFVLPEHGEREWANHFIACVNLDQALKEAGESAHMHLAVAPLYNRLIRDLERANRELWAENAAIARERVGFGDAGAVMLRERVSQLEQELELLRATLAAPRHQSIERARERIRDVPLLDRLAQKIGRRVS